MKDSEKRLAIGAFVILSVIAGLILSQRLRSWQRDLVRNEQALADESKDARGLLQEMPLWNSRDAWLAQHQPVAKSDLEADNESFGQLVDKAKGVGLTVEQKQYQEPVKNEFYSQYGVELTVKGDLPSVFRWIYSVQSPADFRVVPQMKIVPDKEDPAKVVCSIQFWRWYQPSTAHGV